MPTFSHLHVHTQFSLLDGASDISKLMEKAKADGMPAVALTDHGNMFGAFKFVAEANKAGVKPIVGCEFYVVEDRFRKTFTKENRDHRYHQLLLAKNEDGYRNLSKLCSLGYIDGLYSKWPRIDKEILLQYKDGLIATTCCIGAEVPQAIIHKGEEEAEKIFRSWLDIFGEDYYIELQRHHINNIDNTGVSQEDINQLLLKWAAKYNVKTIATNDSHYTDQVDAEAHDILLCVNTGELKSKPVGDGQGFRFGFPNNEFFFKSQAEMAKLFSDLPEALDNTNEIVDKITPPQLKRDILLPNFILPEGFQTEDDYLKHLTFEGAKKRYHEVTAETEERLNHELNIIKTMGFAGYFLIVQDFIAAGRNLGVSVGPGRGSAAGSAVAFCIGITNIDPIKYDLLFERFLNPERVSMPDIDIDFDDEGRQKVIDYVVDKYGRQQVAQIITFGTMAAKSSIRDVARVMDFPLADSDRLAKLIPETPGISLKRAFDEVPELKDARKKDDSQGAVLKLAEQLEGSVRNSGIHAAGIIIAPDDITKYIPVCTSKDTDLWVTQFDGKYIEDAGMLKMDFLGLKTLTIIKDAIDIIRLRHQIHIDPDEIPLDDLKTFELYQKGDTIGTFQFESEGMRTYLRDLKPTNIEDLIAMNALYRPGPMDFIPQYISRKHGKEKVEYPHELLEGILKNTFGIMVYQEQIMQAAQIMAGFSLGAADLLRRAMGKKKHDVMEQQKAVFVEGAGQKGIDAKKAADVFDVMAKFASYGFNRSHSAAYSVVAYQTAYLKANYPAEYMAAVLTNNMNDIKKINFFMDECKRQNIPVLGPDVNESSLKFTVNPEGAIRFGLGAVKGVGEGAVHALIGERQEEGHYRNIFDLVRRVNLRAANKKCLESLAQAGAFDSFEGSHRAQYFYQEANEGPIFLEKVIRFGSTYQEAKTSSQTSLFGDDESLIQIPEPSLPDCDTWGKLDRLQKEKEVTGIYLSGHPLDDYKLEMDSFCTSGVESLKDLDALKNKSISVAGVIISARHRTTKNGVPFGSFVLEDFSDSITLNLFQESYMKFKHFLETGTFVFIKGKVQPRFRNSDSMEFSVTDIQLLSEVREKLAKTIEFNLTLGDISDEWVEKFTQLVDKHPGPCRIRFNITDPSEKWKISMPSKKKSVSLSKEFIDSLQAMQDLEFQLN
ncbi:MAG: DNA polymerase III subunit alpha [Flavobacteriales bacterium]|nr:DNA polymerase III subunit alpha [Flavobacteriales bacterium]